MKFLRCQLEKPIFEIEKLRRRTLPAAINLSQEKSRFLFVWLFSRRMAAVLITTGENPFFRGYAKEQEGKLLKQKDPNYKLYSINFLLLIITFFPASSFL